MVTIMKSFWAVGKLSVLELASRQHFTASSFINQFWFLDNSWAATQKSKIDIITQMSDGFGRYQYIVVICFVASVLC